MRLIWGFAIQLFVAIEMYSPINDGLIKINAYDWPILFWELFSAKKEKIYFWRYVQRILTNLRQPFVFISFKVRDKDLSEEKQRIFFQMILFLIAMLSGNLLKIQYLQEFLM